VQFESSAGFSYGITRSHFYKKRMRIIELVIRETECAWQYSDWEDHITKTTDHQQSPERLINKTANWL